jgi:HEPN domain-containing protein
MAREQPEPGEAETWLAYAREDFAHGTLGAGSFPRSATWSFQQAAEKALKAVLLAAGQSVPRTHDVAFVLGRLLDRFPDAESLKEDVLTIAEITPAIRYPGDWPELQSGDLARFSAATGRILEWAEKTIRESDDRSGARSD